MTALIWLIAVVVTLASAVYQRLTGPTYPVSGELVLLGETIEWEMERTWEGDTDQEITVAVPSDTIRGHIDWKRHKVDEAWTTVPMTFSDSLLVGHLPNQPPAGKLDYTVTLAAGGEEETISNDGRAIVTRYSSGDIICSA